MERTAAEGDSVVFSSCENNIVAKKDKPMSNDELKVSSSRIGETNIKVEFGNIVPDTKAQVCT